MPVYEVHFSFSSMQWVDAVRFVEIEARVDAIDLALEDILQFNKDLDEPVLLEVKKYRGWPDTPNADMSMEGFIKYQRECKPVEVALKWLLDNVYK